MLKKWWAAYQSEITTKTIRHIASGSDELAYWQDLLFLNFLVYCVPVSFIAVVPGVFMALKDGFFIIAAVDISTLIVLVTVTFSHSISLKARKVTVITIFYILSIFLINLLGYIGPGILYLLTLTILVALVLPKRYAYWSILANAIILISFALVIQFGLFHSQLHLQYSAGEWIAFSSNVIFLSIVLVGLINRIFTSLKDTINTGKYLQKRYQNIFEKSPIPMWIYDAETLKFLYVNLAAIRHYGYSEQEFLQMTIKDIRPSKDVPSLEEIVKINQHSGRFYKGLSEHIKKDGQRINVMIESDELLFDDQLVRLVLATDVTDKMRSEKEVSDANLKTKQSEAGLRAIFESAVDGFILIDNDLVIKTFNTNAQKYVRLNRHMSRFEIGSNIIDYIHPTRKNAFQANIQRVLSGEMVEYDRKYMSSLKSTYWIRYTLTPVFDDKTISGVCITARDVTAKKLYLQNVEDQNKTFREISWIQSHLVRAPLSRLMGLSNLLLTSKEEDKESIVRYMMTSADELDAIIKRITQESNQILEKYPVEHEVDKTTACREEGKKVV